uniref:Uncharacterized protein n=1 Tax=Candidatus Kentrum sp. TC TaxID=2126339 RepID=A0A450YHQ7_9GAMM|nr:MAG: hypothetical protein BECKTC1821E_GA0114239_100916 [Candidatus Kentron sp. TC]VFK48355.1 MAG: hypothetical protein BECKTC1821D_GA0114238_105911 [Candidatus Kentron sp. TC]VFK55626.1 MAG: hypothetical protein BECKTC1821F_GA0114240_100760 [Candidatus Kentron sp. TC]
MLAFIRALWEIVAGSRDRNPSRRPPELDCTMAAEILLLIETMGG